MKKKGIKGNISSVPVCLFHHTHCLIFLVKPVITVSSQTGWFYSSDHSNESWVFPKKQVDYHRQLRRSSASCVILTLSCLTKIWKQSVFLCFLLFFPPGRLIQWALQESWLTSGCSWQVQIWQMHNGNLASSSLPAWPRCWLSSCVLEPGDHWIKSAPAPATEHPKQ